MKVLIIAFGHPDNVFSLSHHLSKKVDLTVLFCVSNKQYQDGILEIQLKESDPLLIRDKNRIKEIFPHNINSYIGSDFRLWVFNQKSKKIFDRRNWLDIYKLNRIINKEDFKIIHYNGASGFILPLYYLNKSKSQFWTLHDYKAHSGEENKLSERVNRFIARRKKLTIIQHYENLKNEVAQYFNLSNDKVKLLRSGPLDILNAYSPEVLIKEKYILFFGRISKYKGVDILLEAFSRINQKDTKLVIAGKGNYWFDISKYESNENIILINRYIQTDELVGLIQNSLFVVTPYRDATHSAVIMSAFVFNKPVVSTNLNGITEVVRHNYTGLLYSNSENSVEDLQGIIEGLLSSEEVVLKLTENIKREKKEGVISWSTIIENYIEVYKGN